MATYYARNVAGNWSANTSWDAASSGGAGPAGPPIAGDTAIFDSGFTGTITLTAAAACTVLQCDAGAAGTLAFGAYSITVAGNVTLRATMTYTAADATRGFVVSAASTVTTNGATFTGQLSLSGTAGKTIDSNGTTWGRVYIVQGAQTITLSSALQCTTLDLSVNYGSTTFAGAFGITCDTFNAGSLSAIAITLVAGQTLTINAAINAWSGFTNVLTIKSATASSDTLISYGNTDANCKISGITFTDVNFNTPVVNWLGGTLTRTTNIYNATQASFPAVADVESGVEYGGVDDAAANRLTGTYTSDGDLTEAEAPTGKKFYAGGGAVKTGTGTKTLSAANDTVAAGYYAATTLSAVDADLAAANIAVGTTIFGFVGAAAGGGGAINLDKMGAM